MESTAPVMKRQKWPLTLPLLVAVAMGAGYGVALRYVFGKIGSRWGIDWIMSIAFLVFGSLAIGFLTIRIAERRAGRTVLEWIVVPWLPTMIAFGLALLFHFEGFICFLFALPVAFFFTSIGGLTAGIMGRMSRKRRGVTMACVAIFPLLLAPIETSFAAPVQIHTVGSEIRIHASAATVWQNIERVPAIAPGELQTTWPQRIGFPRPVEATLSYEGVGGVRHASFERGLLFIETVTAWEPEQRLAFGIKADTTHIPPTTLDEHVTIGGRYFDVLDGEYRLEPLPNGDVLLHLTSHQRLSTDFNGYAGLWSDAVMQNLQTSILKVIQHRCEHVNS